MGLTVNDLLAACVEQINKGNGDKTVLITSDDEGNGYHTLFYKFTDDAKSIVDCKRFGLFHDDNDPDGVVLLG